MVEARVESRRERVRRETLAEIKQLARRQIATEGPAAISLRGIAQQMGITTPALYRYFAGRDELVTALVVDGYTSLGECLEAVEHAHERDPRERLLALALAYRGWALAYPGDFTLLMGNPIPNYQLPESTLDAAQRAFASLFRAMYASWSQGRLQPIPESSAAVAARLSTWPPMLNMGMPLSLTALTLEFWGTMHGLVTLELFKHLQPIVGDPSALYQDRIAALISRLSLR